MGLGKAGPRHGVCWDAGTEDEGRSGQHSISGTSRTPVLIQGPGLSTREGQSVGLTTGGPHAAALTRPPLPFLSDLRACKARAPPRH